MRGNLYFITGGDSYEVGERPTWTGGNVAVFVTNTGVVLVDSMLSGSGRDTLAQVRKITDKPVTMIVNTHTHNDHVGSDAEFGASIEIVAHANTGKNMAAMDEFKGPHSTFLPKRTFTGRMTLGSGTDEIDLYYFGRGHTDGDAWVVFPAVRAMHAGDQFARQYMPIVDAARANGNATEFAATLNKARAGIKNVDRVIGGHTPTVMTWPDFENYVDFYNDFLSFVQNAKKLGRSADQAASDYRIPARYVGYYADPARVKTNVQLIYEGR
ncbi:MAG: MBL fold metallo-hydrolase [Acidobacteria bacterium]|nr:MBL fold metallo-hydrolase [Acidobacteriota bacterium]